MNLPSLLDEDELEDTNAALSACRGSSIFKYTSDSYFHFFGIPRRVFYDPPSILPPDRVVHHELSWLRVKSYVIRQCVLPIE